jgi:dTDP-D-glucose 4,6-dehydratase
MTKRILVTGGAGFIGSHLVDKLIKLDYRVVIIDNLSTGKKENINAKARFYKIDISSPKIVEIFKKEGPEIVFHLAALPRVPLSVKEPVLTSRVNVLGTINIFKASIDSKVKRVIFASSSSVYGDQKKLPLRENMLPNPISPYGLQKYVCEQFAKLFSNLYKIPPNLKLRGHTKKYIFKKLAEKYIPKKCIYRRKQGFSIPLDYWLREDLFNFLQENILSQSFLDFGFNKIFLEKLIKEHHEKIQNNGIKLWSLLMLNQWLQTFCK